MRELKNTKIIAVDPVSYTHLDVYKRQPEALYPPLCWIILWTVRFRNHAVILSCLLYTSINGLLLLSDKTSAICDNAANSLVSVQ